MGVVGGPAKESGTTRNHTVIAKIGKEACMDGDRFQTWSESSNKGPEMPSTLLLSVVGQLDGADKQRQTVVVFVFCQLLFYLELPCESIDIYPIVTNMHTNQFQARYLAFHTRSIRPGFSC